MEALAIPPAPLKIFSRSAQMNPRAAALTALAGVLGHFRNSFVSGYRMQGDILQIGASEKAWKRHDKPLCLDQRSLRGKQKVDFVLMQWLAAQRGMISSVKKNA